MLNALARIGPPSEEDLSRYLDIIHQGHLAIKYEEDFIRGSLDGEDVITYQKPTPDEKIESPWGLLSQCYFPLVASQEAFTHLINRLIRDAGPLKKPSRSR